jgi:hypothetical protein
MTLILMMTSTTSLRIKSTMHKGFDDSFGLVALRVKLKFYTKPQSAPANNMNIQSVPIICTALTSSSGGSSKGQAGVERHS